MGWNRAALYVYLPDDSATYQRSLNSDPVERYELHEPTPITSQQLGKLTPVENVLKPSQGNPNRVSPIRLSHLADAAWSGALHTVLGVRQ